MLWGQLFGYDRQKQEPLGWRKDQKGSGLLTESGTRGNTDRAEAEGEQFPLRSWSSCRGSSG